jgi:hypothetical protein
MIPVLRRITSLRFVLRRARETRVLTNAPPLTPMAPRPMSFFAGQGGRCSVLSQA